MIAYSCGLIQLPPDLDTETVPDDDCSRGNSADDDDWECITIGGGGGSHESTGSLSSLFDNSPPNLPWLVPLPIVLQSIPNILSLISL